MEFNFSSAILAVGPDEPAVWIATPVAALFFTLATYLLGRHVWLGAFSWGAYLARAVGCVILLVGLLIPFAGFHGLLMSAAFAIIHGERFGFMLCTMFVPWCRLALLGGGLSGFVIALIGHLRKNHHDRPRPNQGAPSPAAIT